MNANASSVSTDATAAEKRAMQDALYTALESGLRLLHPFMPFVTEELWQRLPRVPGVTDGVESIMLTPYPTPVAAWTDAAAEADLEHAMTVVKAVRSLRSAYGLVRRVLACSRANRCMHTLFRSDTPVLFLPACFPPRSCRRRGRSSTCTRAPTRRPRPPP
jgi:valyl-tRNA synthetase